MATIKDVAAHAGVSTATVSRILANPDICLPETRARVLAAVSALDYVPNYAAKSLRTFKSSTIIVTVPDISNPYFSMVLRGIEDVAQAARYSVLLGDTRVDPAREEVYGNMLLRKEADGLIFLGQRVPPNLDRMIADMGGRAPIVNGGEFDCPADVSSVHIDNAQASADIIDYLYGLGHRRIAAIGGPAANPTARERMGGVRRAALKLQIHELLTMVHAGVSIEAGEQAAHDLLALDTPPTAICCFSDEQALGVLMAIRQRGLTCPGDISVAGFDDTRYARVSYPPLTTVHQPMVDMGRAMVHLLLDIMSGKVVKPRAVTLKHALIPRESTGAPKHIAGAASDTRHPR